MITLQFSETSLGQILAAFKLAIKHAEQVTCDKALTEELVEVRDALEQKIMNALRNDVVQRARNIGISQTK